MKHLRYYIRQILLEVDLGNKVWADRAAAGQISNHWGDEPDTEIEEDLWDTLSMFMHSNVGIDDPAMLSAIRDAAKDPKYQDIFITRDSPFWRNRGLSRGQSLPKDHVEKMIGIKIPSYEEVKDELAMGGWLTINLMDTYLYKPENFFRDDRSVSSWTDEDEVAQNFATGDLNNFSMGRNLIPVIFHAARGSGEFLDFRNMYYYQGLETYDSESEYMALGHVPVDKIEIQYKEFHSSRGEW